MKHIVLCDTALMAVYDAPKALFHKRTHKLWIILARAIPHIVPE